MLKVADKEEQLQQDSFKDSVLLTTSDQSNFVKNTVPNYSSSTKFNLLFRGSRDGWKSTDFHSNCDNKGPTITIIKSNAGKVCGGFTSLAWGSYIGMKSDLSAYLFSVDHKTKYMNNGT